MPDDDRVVVPGQFSHQRCDNCVSLPVNPVELPYREQAGAGESPKVRMAIGQVSGQAVHGVVATGGRLDLGADVGADLPVGVDLSGVDGRSRPTAGPSG